jgi:amino acid transporter
MIIGCAFTIPIGLAYAFLAVTMPRSGGDYVWVSRGIHPLLGFAIGWAYWVSYGVANGSGAYLFSSVGLPDTIAVYGYALHNPSLIAASTWVTQPGPAFVSALLLLVFAAAIGGLRGLFHRSMVVSFVLIVVSVIVFCAILGTSSHADFVNAVNGYGGTGITYDGIIKQAEATGWSWSGTAWGLTMGSIPLGFLLFTIPSNACAASGEVKNVRTNMPLVILVCQGLALIVNVVGVQLLMNVVGYPFVQASIAVGSAWPLAAPPWAILFASMLTNNLVLITIMFLGWLAYFVYWAAAIFLCATRYVFAFSFDRAFPAMFADISERFHFPVKATILSFVAAVIFLILTAFTTWVGMFLNMTTLGCIVWAIGSVCAIILPYRKNRKELAVGLPGSKWPIQLISIIGVLSLAVNLMVIYFALTTSFVGPSTPASSAILILIFVSGGLIFAVRSLHLRRQGFSLNQVYSQIPPE